MSAVIEGFASNDFLHSFVPDRVAVPLALDTDLEIFDLRDQVYTLVI